MIIEFQGHIHDLRRSVNGKIMATVQLEAERGNSQKIEILLSQEEAKAWMPGTQITIRIWPVPKKD